MDSAKILFLSLVSLITVAAFAVGLRFRRMDAAPSPGQSLADVRRFGLAMMVTAPLFLIFVVVGVGGGWMEVG